MQKYFVLLFFVLLTACRPGKVTELIGEEQPIRDSFIVPYTGRSEISQAIAMSDSVLYSFDREGYAYTLYRRSGAEYQLKEKIILSNASEALLGFFMDSSGAPNFISVENTWFKLDTAGKLYAYDTIRLGLQYLRDRFRIFSTRHRPLLLIDERLYFSPIWRALEDYNTYLKEPCLVSVSLNPQDTARHREYFTKPVFFKESPNPRIAYCFNGREIVMLYPNRDTLYCYNIVSAQYTKKAIRNSFYSQPELVDQAKFWEEAYNTTYKLHNFEYKAIWYNKNTDHYILMYSVPVDKSIKVPTYDDQPDHVLVLNERFEPLRYIVFKEQYFNSNVFQTPQGLAMPVYSKSQKKIQHDIPIKYYVYNF